jgi:hypothetical protein
VFRDSNSSDYLVTAREWLQLVQKREPHMSATKYLLRDVQRDLA